MSRNSPDLTLGISTTAKNISRLKIRPPERRLSVLVSLQGRAEPRLPKHVRVIRCQGIGVGHSRNAVIENTNTELLAFCDDDVLPNYDQLLEAADQLVSSGYDFYIGRLFDFDGNPRKRYSWPGTEARFHNIGKVGTPEILIRVSALKKSGVRFDPSFGAGTLSPLGDELIFLSDCLKSGLKGQHISAVFGFHSAESSGRGGDLRKLAHRLRAGRRAYRGNTAYIFPMFFAKTVAGQLFRLSKEFLKAQSPRRKNHSQK